MYARRCAEKHAGERRILQEWDGDEPCSLDFDDWRFDYTDPDGEERPPWEVYQGVRLSERCPDHFWRYFDLFVRFWPRKMFHRKIGYPTGFLAVKKRRTGQLLPLFDNLAVETTERHLEYDTWFEWKERQVELFRRPDPIWFGLHIPKYTRTDLIDIDAKKYLLGYYRDDFHGHGRLMPVVHLPLEHFQLLKRVYDAFPDRIWCVSSETLGVHAWRLHRRPVSSGKLHAENKERLSGIGLAEIEAHPMPGRCLRRPFGADYGTITPHGVLEHWTDQLDYFERDARTPTFVQVCRALVERMARQWERWQNAPYSYGPLRQEVKWGIVQDRLQQHADEIGQVAEWIKAGCPLDAPSGPQDSTHSLLVQVFQETVGERPRAVEPIPASQPSPRSIGSQARRSTTNDGLADLRNGQWVKTLARLAGNGLDREDFIGTAAHEFAKWLYWIELYRQPEDQRTHTIQRLLTSYILKKHNGFITRLTNGQKAEVVAQVSRCLDSAVRLSPPHREESLALFARIREKWESGRYEYPLRLEPLLNGDPEQLALPDPPSPSSSSPCLLTFMCMRLDDSPLPPAVAAMIQKHAGRAKVIPFATRLLNWLCNHKGRAHLGREALSKMLGYTDPTRIQTYLRILERAGVIVRGKSYCKGRNGKECRLAEEAVKLFVNNQESKVQEEGQKPNEES